MGRKSKHSKKTWNRIYKSKDRKKESESGSRELPMDVPQCCGDLVGCIYSLLNERHLGFKAPSSIDHPAACLRCCEERERADFYKGQTARELQIPNRFQHRVSPSPKNGLKNDTMFDLYSPVKMTPRKLLINMWNRHMGNLDPADLDEMRRKARR